MSAVARVPILMYHKIAPIDRRSKVPGHYVHPGLFHRHLSLLKAFGFETVSLATLFREPLPKRPVVITFDDGYRNYLTHALPALKAKEFTATVFLVANQIGGTNAWDVALGDVEEPLMSEADLLAAKLGGTEFGSHTLDHVHLDQVDADTAWDQIATSKALLEERLGLPVTTFCYPYGGRTPDVEKMVERAGYSSACSVSKGVNTPSTERYALRRINVRSDTWTPVLLAKLWRALRSE